MISLDRDFGFQRQSVDSIGLSSPFPHIRICHAPCFHERGLLRELTCLQITATVLYFTWAVDEQGTLKSRLTTAVQNHLGGENHDGDHGVIFPQDIEAVHSADSLLENHANPFTPAALNEIWQSADFHPPFFEDHDDVLPGALVSFSFLHLS